MSGSGMIPFIRIEIAQEGDHSRLGVWHVRLVRLLRDRGER